MEPLGITLFCDDIRFELNQKTTLIGCYGPEMLIFGTLPTVLPKIGMYVQLRLPPGSSSPSQILVYFPGSKEEEPDVTVDIGAPSPENIERSQQPSQAGIVSLLATNVPILLGPTLIKEEGLIKVRVKCDEKMIKAGTLKVTSVVDTEQTLQPNNS
jgi:hypothetical protein